MKVCLICASGGHLTEMLKISDAFSSHETFLITYKEKFTNPSTNISKKYYLKNILVNNVQANRLKKSILIMLQMLLLTVNQLKIFIKEKPDFVISTGSEIAIPMFYIAKLARKDTIFIESLCRIDGLSGTGKIVRPVSNLFLVQWENLSKLHPKNQYHGSILSRTPTLHQKEIQNDIDSFIFVTVGTAPFPRLVENMDVISQRVNDRVVMQIGNTEYKPKNAEYFDFIENEEIRTLNREARVVVCHSGVGSILTALEENGDVIVFPRFSKFRENIDDHQLEITNILQKECFVKVAYNSEELLNLLTTNNIDNSPKKPNDNDALKGPNLVDYLSSLFMSYNCKHISDLYER